MRSTALLPLMSLLAGISMGSACAYAADSPYAKLDMAPDKAGPQTDQADITKLCGTKPIRVALSDGFYGNSWRKTALAELKDEASKCPNITEVIHTDGQGNAQKQIADIEGLAAQHVDVILVFPDFGASLIKAMRDATAAGSAVVPYDTGLHFPGERLKDYLVAVTEDQRTKAEDEAKWATDALKGKGMYLEFGGVAVGILHAHQIGIMRQGGEDGRFDRHAGDARDVIVAHRRLHLGEDFVEIGNDARAFGVLVVIGRHHALRILRCVYTNAIATGEIECRNLARAGGELLRVLRVNAALDRMAANRNRLRHN